MLRQANWMLRKFGWFKVPLIGYCRPRITRLDEQGVEVIIPLSRRTRNHLGSMYFGALAVGADVAGAFLALHLAQRQGEKISLAFKGVSGEFLKRPERDVCFICDDGPAIVRMLQETIQSGQRVNQPVQVRVTCPEQFGAEDVARFALVLSVKKIS